MGLLTFLAIILGWVAASKMRGRIRELETRTDVQQAAIDGLTEQLRRLRRDGVAAEAGPAAQQATPREDGPQSGGDRSRTAPAADSRRAISRATTGAASRATAGRDSTARSTVAAADSSASSA